MEDMTETKLYVGIKVISVIEFVAGIGKIIPKGTRGVIVANYRLHLYTVDFGKKYGEVMIGCNKVKKVRK